VKTLSAQSPAKINLTLRVVGKRADEFHEIESLVVRVELCDTISVTRHENGCFSLDCDDRTLPGDGSNLVLRAARTLAEAAGVNRGADIVLRKRIPAGAGLGGGSSNAATTLMLLNEAWGLGLPAAELERIGAELGSDVPPCVIRGRGELVEDVPTPLRGWATLILPGLHCSTAAVYAAYGEPQRRQERGGRRRRELDLSRLVAEGAGAAARLMDRLFNDLEIPAFEVVPELRRLAERAAEIAGGPVRMTGSGAALFRLFDEEAEARQFALAAAGALSVRTEVVRLAVGG
jgi:4-diphosphocytidyl-2-C-methyl-D-erythritol kinase